MLRNAPLWGRGALLIRGPGDVVGKFNRDPGSAEQHFVLPRARDTGYRSSGSPASHLAPLP
jgi:hypothetical protein